MVKQGNTQTRSESRRTAILEAAQKCFFQYGLERTRMDDIARRAQISRPALYEHFDNKSAIFLALARHLIESFLTAAERELQGSGSVWQRIAAAFEVWSVKPLEMIMAGPHADEMILAGSGVAHVLREASQAGEVDLKKAGLTATAAADLIVAAAAGAKEDWKDVARYRQRLAGLIRVFATATAL
jgi:AcrR family transcriptional regulator